ncbi:hypothetical protein [Pedobacter panaciterrae]|uniref:hypothetical protein n=1 Tax=Pedobacter panaciterrae TaxID=363849 RepID=UPI0025955BB3|nr:hypothetical protein [uncultured Pedobacter sp.]
MNELTSSIISGIVGGLIVWVVQQWYSNRRERIKQDQDLIASSSHSKKVINAHILDMLKPGRDINLVYETLGQPAIKAKSDLGVFSDESVTTNSYLYVLKNAYLKITSKNNESIDSLTIFPFDTRFKLEGLPNPMGLDTIIFNESQINGFNEEGFGHTVIVARHDESFAISQTIVNPLNLVYTYFGYFGGDDSMGNWRTYKLNNDPKAFIGGTLTGICISSLDEDAFYIYAYEV